MIVSAALNNGYVFRIRPRTDDDCRLVVDWVPDAEALYLLSGTRLHWPLDETQLSVMSSIPGFSAWMLIDPASGEPIGHFDLTTEGTSARVSRILIAPAMRGRGLAHVLVGLAIEQARALGASELTLNVIVGNEPAIRTYLRAGFADGPVSQRSDVRLMTLAL